MNYIFNDSFLTIVYNRVLPHIQALEEFPTLEYFTNNNKFKFYNLKRNEFGLSPQTLYSYFMEGFNKTQRNFISFGTHGDLIFINSNTKLNLLSNKTSHYIVSDNKYSIKFNNLNEMKFNLKNIGDTIYNVITLNSFTIGNNLFTIGNNSFNTGSNSSSSNSNLSHNNNSSPNISNNSLPNISNNSSFKIRNNSSFNGNSLNIVLNPSSLVLYKYLYGQNKGTLLERCLKVYLINGPKFKWEKYKEFNESYLIKFNIPHTIESLVNELSSLMYNKKRDQIPSTPNLVKNKMLVDLCNLVSPTNIQLNGIIADYIFDITIVDDLLTFFQN